MENSLEENERNLNLDTLIAIIILVIYTVAAPIFDKIHFHYMHESGLCMIIGVLITSLSSLMSSNKDYTKSLNFNEGVFFTFVLPLIIFSAGYNLRRQSFFKYFMYIITFGVLGTVMSFLVVSPLTYIFNRNNMFTLYNDYEIIEYNNETYNNNSYNNNTENILIDYSNKFNENINNEINETIINNNDNNENNLNNTNNNNITETKPSYNKRKKVINFSISEILLFASVISATDTIAALTFIHEETEPKLFAILFGEGVINDAVCIVLYRILRDFTSTGQEFTSSTPLMMFGKFLNLAIFSFIIGMVVGILCAYLLKKFKENNINLNRTQEISVIIFFAFISYTLAEEMGLSSIVTLLFCGMFMSNYAFYNLSFQGREESSVVSRMLSNIAEAFVFTYLGLTLITYIKHSLSISFIIIELFVVIFGRIFSIFFLCYLMKFFGVHSFKMKTSQKGIMSCAGSIRGAIAFGLAISIDTSNKLHKEILVTSTLILVFFTTIVLGAMMPLLINLMKKLDFDDDNNNELVNIKNPDDLLKCDEFTFIHPNFSEKYEGSKEKNIEILRSRLSYWLGHYWFEFDDMYIKPKLCFKWPWIKEDNMNLKKVIITSINKYEEEQKKVDHFIREDYQKKILQEIKMKRKNNNNDENNNENDKNLEMNYMSSNNNNNNYNYYDNNIIYNNKNNNNDNLDYNLMNDKK
jgi:NhaP-type Na+/H+ or K+/H+ antiporter